MLRKLLLDKLIHILLKTFLESMKLLVSPFCCRWALLAQRIVTLVVIMIARRNRLYYNRISLDSDLLINFGSLHKFDIGIQISLHFTCYKSLRRSFRFHVLRNIDSRQALHVFIVIIRSCKISSVFIQHLWSVIVKCTMGFPVYVTVLEISLRYLDVLDIRNPSKSHFLRLLFMLLRDKALYIFHDMISNIGI